MSSAWIRCNLHPGKIVPLTRATCQATVLPAMKIKKPMVRCWITRRVQVCRCSSTACAAQGNIDCIPGQGWR